MKLPITRRGCIDEYERRRETDAPLTKLDMYLGGMICCSEDEFLYRKPIDVCVIGGDPCMCHDYDVEDFCRGDCIKNTEVTLNMVWNAPLYGGNEK